MLTVHFFVNEHHHLGSLVFLAVSEFNVMYSDQVGEVRTGCFVAPPPFFSFVRFPSEYSLIHDSPRPVEVAVSNQ